MSLAPHEYIKGFAYGLDYLCMPLSGSLTQQAFPSDADRGHCAELTNPPAVTQYSGNTFFILR